MRVVAGIDALAQGHGPTFIVVGVFDGLHLGHQYLLRELVTEAAARSAVPTVITFDHHPDEVLTGHAPPLLIDPEERLERLRDTGVGVTVVQHFDADLRAVPYDAFVERIRACVQVAGFLMTPDAAFGFERRGTPTRSASSGPGTASMSSSSRPSNLTAARSAAPTSGPPSVPVTLTPRVVARGGEPSP